MTTLDQIAAELAGYDPQAMSADTVNAFLAQLVEPLTDVQQLGIFQALGRVLAADVISPISVPPHDNSAMDGYAFDGNQLNADKALTLKVIGTALAGKAWSGTVSSGECLKIMTGAVMPPGLNTVVPQEFVALAAAQDSDSMIPAPSQPVSDTSDPQKAQHITIPPGIVRLGDNHRRVGEDLMRGQPSYSHPLHLG
jgi:molybdopterin molybdotransferase